MNLRGMMIIVVLVLVVGVGAGLLALRAAPAPDKPVRDQRFVTLGQLAEDLANDPKSFDALVDKLGTNVAFVDDAKKAVLKQLFAAANYEGLDRQPELTLDELRVALDLLAEQRKSTTTFAPRTTEVKKEALGIPTNRSAPEGGPS